jgi:hypothetical protein
MRWSLPSDGHGFNREDAEVLRPRAKALRETGELPSRKDTLERLKKYKNTQLKAGGIDYDAIKASEKERAKGSKKVEITVDPVVEEKARQILYHGDLVEARRKHIGKSVYGEEPAIDALTYICLSAYLGDEYVIHGDMIGDSQLGKTTIIDNSLGLQPPEDIESFSEMSPKYVYYKCEETDFHGKVLYIDDARDEHIPILKSLRNDTEGRQGHGTVINGGAVDMELNGRPAVIASCIEPLRDAQGQAVSRSLQVSVSKPSEDVEKKVKAKIRTKIARNALNRAVDDNQEKLVIQQASRILRDHGIKDIVVPFDAEKPKGSGRRATGQYERLILS